MTLIKARMICNDIVNERYPGYYLLMDRLSRDAYASLWGLEDSRVEVVFPRKLKDTSCARIAEYKIS